MGPHDMNRAISRTFFYLRIKAFFKISLSKKLADGLPPVTADVQQINHLFMNIILNAAQAMEGNGTLDIMTLLQTSAGRVTVEISDTGPGIPA